jgi:hypothetical protein
MHPDTIRDRIEAQGYTGLSDARLQSLDPWLRATPAVTLMWAALATAQQSIPGLAALVPFVVAGIVLPVHPFDMLLAPLRRRLNGPDIPVSQPPRRFAALLAAVMLEGATWAFAAGHPGLGTALGGTLVAAAGLNVATGHCAASWLFAILFGPVARPVNATNECP